MLLYFIGRVNCRSGFRGKYSAEGQDFTKKKLLQNNANKIHILGSYFGDLNAMEYVHLLTPPLNSNS